MNNLPLSSPVATRTRGIDQKRPVAKNQSNESSESSSSTSTRTRKNARGPRKIEKKQAKPKKTKSVAAHVSTDSRGETSEDDVAVNQTLNTCKRKIVRTTKQRRWSVSADGQDEGKENLKTPKMSTHPRKTAVASADNFASTPVGDTLRLSPNPSSSRRKSAASVEARKRSSKSGEWSSLPLTPTVQSTPGRRPRVSSPATPSSRIKKNAKGETPLHVAAIKVWLCI